MRLARRRALEAARLRTIGPFSDCSRSELRRISSLMTEVAVPAGRVLLHAGEPAAEFLLVVRGAATVLDDRHEPVAVVGPGACFGAAEVLQRTAWPATVVAASDVGALVASRREFLDPRFLVPSVADRLGLGAAELARTCVCRCGSVLTVATRDDEPRHARAGDPRPVRATSVGFDGCSRWS
ncbi:MAG TPA: cyclic nucleotide-binding domain-containing protein [Acidimicrobiales bacterium]|nr:cyclic nucleotide-binding domain-containing protein [Acidimicrobiales bacterium]